MMEIIKNRFKGIALDFSIVIYQPLVVEISPGKNIFFIHSLLFS
tara:strand:- start:194 stop:325 length:132 start_codon:yes stop_codon:yes gene_type:complete